MAPSPVRLLAIVALLWLSAAAVARADYENWSYTWVRDPYAVAANAGAQSGGVSLLLPTLPPGGGQGSSPIAPMVIIAGTAAEGTYYSPADQFQNAPYTVTLQVTDNQTGVSHDFVFQGLLNGTMTTGQVDLSSTFVGGNEQTFTISGRPYTATLNFVAPDAPTASFAGQITATVDPPDAASPSATPEPASLVLAGLTLPLIGFGAWRKLGRRRLCSIASA